MLEYILYGAVLLYCFGALAFAFYAQRSQNRMMSAVLSQHADILEHLKIAANPEAWVAEQAQKAREERKRQEPTRQPGDAMSEAESGVD